MRARFLRVGVGAGALAVLLGVGAPTTLYRSARVLSDARRWASLDSLEARRRTFGRDYVDAIEAIRHTLPRDASYMLVPRTVPAATGWELWVRYDLAPRRPILIRPQVERGLRGPRGGAVPGWVRWVVLPGDDGTPLLLGREELRARARARDDGK